MVNGAPATAAAGRRPLSTPAASTTISPSTVSAAMVRMSAPSCRLCVLAPQRRSKAKAVDGRKPEQEGKERRLEEKHPAIGGANQPSHAATENPALETGGPAYRRALTPRQCGGIGRGPPSPWH